MEFETTILGGLPVLVKFTMCPAEPDVGILSEYVDEYELCSVKTGKPLGDWAQRRLEETKGEDKLLAECRQAAQDARDDAAIQRAEDRADFYAYNW